VTGPEHYQLSEQLLEHAASMLSTDVAPEHRDELIQRQAAVASMATAHAVLAAAATLGLSLHLGPPDERAWNASAATPVDG
jgi:DMSO reductase anchor subunit